jgi:hypothetical protein
VGQFAKLSHHHKPIEVVDPHTQSQTDPVVFRPLSHLTLAERFAQIGHCLIVMRNLVNVQDQVGRRDEMAETNSAPATAAC